jgi:hypothetical protein
MFGTRLKEESYGKTGISIYADGMVSMMSMSAFF